MDFEDPLFLQKFLEARRWQADWLRRYVESGGTFYDKDRQQWVTKENIGT